MYLTRREHGGNIQIQQGEHGKNIWAQQGQNIVVGTSGPKSDSMVLRGISGPKTAWC